MKIGLSLKADRKRDTLFPSLLPSPPPSPVPTVLKFLLLRIKKFVLLSQEKKGGKKLVAAERRAHINGMGEFSFMAEWEREKLSRGRRQVFFSFRLNEYLNLRRRLEHEKHNLFHALLPALSNFRGEMSLARACAEKPEFVSYVSLMHGKQKSAFPRVLSHNRKF